MLYSWLAAIGMEYGVCDDSDYYITTFASISFLHIANTAQIMCTLEKYKILISEMVGLRTPSNQKLLTAETDVAYDSYVLLILFYDNLLLLMNFDVLCAFAPLCIQCSLL